MTIIGCDFSTRYIDLVALDEDTDAASWHRFELEGADAFDRARSVRRALRPTDGTGWLPLFEDVLAVGIEDPRGYGAGSLYRVQGAVLASIPSGLLVQPWIPSAWRKQVGLSGNASKEDVSLFAHSLRLAAEGAETVGWPYDATDAFCIALATRTLLEQVAA